jgi:hypothetical protein
LSLSFHTGLDLGLPGHAPVTILKIGKQILRLVAVGVRQKSQDQIPPVRRHDGMHALSKDNRLVCNIGVFHRSAAFAAATA